MPRIVPRINFAATSCVAGLQPLPAEKKAHAHRVRNKAQVRHGYSHPPKSSSTSHTGRIMANGKYTGKLTIGDAERKLIEELNKL